LITVSTNRNEGSIKEKKDMLMERFKALSKGKEEVNHHFIFIEAPIEIVGPEIVFWGEALWWPQNCPVRFIREGEGPVREGTRYQHKVLRPFPLSGLVEVTRLVPNRLIERTFRGGVFKGVETVMIEERANGTRVDYDLSMRFRDPVNMFLWPLLYRRFHDDNIRLILEALKDYAVKKHQEMQDKGPG
jgi:hypothetical protein